MNLLLSAVKTIVVCYAEAPDEFDRNHPLSSDNMHLAWTLVYLEEFRG